MRMRDVSLVYVLYVMPTNFFVSLRNGGWKWLASSVAVLLHCQVCQELRRGFLGKGVHHLNSPTTRWHLLTRLRHQG